MKATEEYCPSCRTVKREGNFYVGLGIQNNGRLPICKECCHNKLIKYSAILGNEGGAWALFGELGIPFIRDAWKSAQIGAKSSATQGGTNTDELSVYLKRLKDKGVGYQGFWDSDTTLEELTSSNGQKKKAKAVDSVDDLNAMQNKWGVYDSQDAYDFLENTFNDYTSDLYDMDANLTNRYKDLCIAEYAKRKAQEGGDIAEISKAQDNVTKQLKLLKLDDFQPETTDEREKFIDRLAWMIEETEPAEEEDINKYRDIAGFESAFNEIMRSMRNLITGSKEYPDIPKEER